MTRRISLIRLKHWDYGSPGLYFITICTYQGAHYFGDIGPPPGMAAPPPGLPFDPKEIDDNAKRPPGMAALRETEIGRIAREFWYRIPEFHPYVILDAFVIMPNHIHGILMIDKPGYQEWNTNIFGPQSNNLASILRGYKSAVTTYAREQGILFRWHYRYHDHIIRTEKALKNIRNYIWSNPENWGKDRFHH